MSTSCLACSRTTGGPTIRNAILGFLEAYPTPSAVLEASDKELEVCIGPLGLQEVRRKALQRMSHEFFAKVLLTSSPLPLIPSNVHGGGGGGKSLTHGRDGLSHAASSRWESNRSLMFCMQKEHHSLLMSWGLFLIRQL